MSNATWALRRPVGLVLAAAFPLSAAAASDADIKELREQVLQMKQDYEQRIRQLEQRLAEAERNAAAAAGTAGKAENAAVQAEKSAAAARETAEQTARRPTAENAFNPAISLILSGTYASLSKDPGSYRIDGFVPSLGEISPPQRSFSLGESELTLSASVDPYFSGYFTAAITPENEVEVEEAYVRTLALPYGTGIKAGRFLSGVGYLNAQHPHTWDFTDAPLPYKAFFGSQLTDDGAQLTWVAPSELFLQFGIEGARFLSFPGTDVDRNKNGLMSGAGFAKIGGDAGPSNSWQAGLSYVETKPQDRTDAEDAPSFAISGSSKTAIADFVWKWAPEGNARERSLKIQGEYFWRRENGTLTAFVPSDSCAGECSGDYSSRQSGWYLQGVYKFLPAWRAGLRYDRLDYGKVDIGVIDSAAVAPEDLAILQPHDPSRWTAMVDWSPSEFARIRLQYARDKARLGETDNQLWIQYIMSLGAHGAHKF
jgi:hypothetical protein